MRKEFIIKAECCSSWPKIRKELVQITKYSALVVKKNHAKAFVLKLAAALKTILFNVKAGDLRRASFAS